MHKLEAHGNRPGVQHEQVLGLGLIGAPHQLARVQVPILSGNMGQGSSMQEKALRENAGGATRWRRDGRGVTEHVRALLSAHLRS